jgi:hypothetical protein
LKETEESLRVASEKERRLVDAALDAASTGKAPDRQWLLIAWHPGPRWEDIEVTVK